MSAFIVPSELRVADPPVAVELTTHNGAVYAVQEAVRLPDSSVHAKSTEPQLYNLKLLAIQRISNHFQKYVGPDKGPARVAWKQNIDARKPWLNANQHDLYIDIKFVQVQLFNLNKDLIEKGYPEIPSCRKMSNTENCIWNEENFQIDQLLDLL